MKKQITILLINIIGALLFIGISQAYMELFDQKKMDLAWGMQLYHSYKFFFIILGISLFFSNLKNRKVKIAIKLLLSVFFVIYWLPAFNPHPYRAPFMALSGLAIYVLCNLCLVIKIGQKKQNDN